MESIRQQKVARLIQKELSEIFQHDGMTFSGGALLTITTVRVTSDLSIARVYLSIFASSDSKKVLENLKAATKEIRYKLGQRVKLQLRIVPELKFMEDDTLDFIERIDDLLKQ
jgi:ribosome-binding factor A